MATDQAAKTSLMGVADSTMKADPDIRPSRYDQKDGQSYDTANLALAVVTFVDYEKFAVSVRTTGTDYQHVPIPLTFGGAGRRHFLGAMPEIGDTCIVGWGQQQAGTTRQPIILGWVLSGVMAGHDWWPMQEHAPDEWGYAPKDRLQWEGIADRSRHKLRHMLPGNVMASSSQGSDLVLDESVKLMNRRGNEMILRDQDQALVIRSLQQFHAGSGFRLYTGMVQRDAFLLPSTMFSDGTNWAAAQQVDAEGVPLEASQLAKSDVPRGRLTPNSIFDVDLEEGISEALNPYSFLQNALIIDSQGRVTAPVTSDAVYGGKSLYRVSVDGSNPAVDTQAQALTEYRVEMTHTSDGTLPVTEQTDGFDSDRLPDTAPREISPLNSKTPFIEFVMGSVVGNDPFSTQGKPLYGIPIRPMVFDGDARVPGLVSGVGSALTDHAAFMLKVRSPFDASAQPSFITFTKDGRLKASLTSAASYSAEVAAGSGLRFGLGRTADGQSLVVEGDGRIFLRSLKGDNATNRGVEIVADQGAVRIFGGQSETVGGLAQRATPTGGGNSSLPGVTVESATNMLLKASGQLVLSAPILLFQNVGQMGFSTTNAFQVSAGDMLSLSSKVINITSFGKTTQTFGGPKDSDATATPLRDTQFVGTASTGLVGGTVDRYAVEYGGREETFENGDHSTTITVGDMTYETQSGTWKAVAGQNSLSLDSSNGLDASVATGSISMSASAGSIDLEASTTVTIKATGTATLQGATVTLKASSGKSGGIVCQSDIDPVSGQTLGSLGMGSTGHLLAVG
jgi:hypothetical protein